MAWQKRPSIVAVAVLLGGDVIYKDMLPFAFAMLRPANTMFLFETKKPDVALSRNILAAQALKEGCEWIFYLDADVIPPTTVLQDLLFHNLPIITGLYWRRYEELDPCIYHIDKEKGIPVTYKHEEIESNRQIIEVDGCGAGCLLIHTDVFEKLKPHTEKFDIRDPSTEEILTCWKFWEYIVHHNVNLSEDIVLTSKVKGLGYRIFADCTIRCGHLTNAMIKENKFEQTPLITGQGI